jgi:hypothetical protein
MDEGRRQRHQARNDIAVPPRQPGQLRSALSCLRPQQTARPDHPSTIVGGVVANGLHLVRATGDAGARERGMRAGQPAGRCLPGGGVVGLPERDAGHALEQQPVAAGSLVDDAAVAGRRAWRVMREHTPIRLDLASRIVYGAWLHPPGLVVHRCTARVLEDEGQRLAVAALDVDLLERRARALGRGAACDPADGDGRLRFGEREVVREEGLQEGVARTIRPRRPRRRNVPGSRGIGRSRCGSHATASSNRGRTRSESK